MQPNFMRMRKYLDKGFNWPQLMEIGWGIQNGLSDEQIGVYAQANLSYEQMRAYREAFERGASPETAEALSKIPSLYDWEIKELLSGKTETKDILLQRNQRLDYWQQQQVRYAANEGIDLTPYLAIGGYDWRQLKEIRLGKQLKLDVAKYADVKLLASEMRAIREGLEKDIDVTPYLSKGVFNKAQIREIRKGIIQKVAVSVYARPELAAPQMRELRRGLAQGLAANQVAQFAAPELSWVQMREIANTLQEELQEETWELE